MMACRSGCPTQSHATYGECLQSANITVAATVASNMGDMYSTTKKELNEYQRARRHGIQPEGTTTTKINDAIKATEILGRPYNAEVDPPAAAITTKKAAAFVNKTSDGAL